MKLSEKHIIDRSHRLFGECDSLCYKSKNIYNHSLYLVKEDMTLYNSFDVLNDLFNVMKVHDSFKSLPMKVATATIMQVQKNYKGYFKALKAYKANPSKFLGKPKEPQYKHKVNGRFIVSYNFQAISKKVFNVAKKIKLSGTDIEFSTKVTDFSTIACVTICPSNDQYVINVIYNVPDVEVMKYNNKVAAIDLGINNLAAVTYNIKGQRPVLYNGKPLKSINQYYNKQLAKYKSELDIKQSGQYKSHRIHKLTNKRNNKISNYLHKTSKMLVESLSTLGISKLVIGHNDQWKNKTIMGTKNNQGFVQIPHSRFIDMLSYKCERKGIKVIIQEESYTSKASFLSLDDIPTYVKGDETEHTFSGYRIHRGLYKLKGKNISINADINASYNIMRKAVPNCNKNGIEGVVVNPVLTKVSIN